MLTIVSFITFMLDVSKIEFNIWHLLGNGSEKAFSRLILSMVDNPLKQTKFGK